LARPSNPSSSSAFSDFVPAMAHKLVSCSIFHLISFQFIVLHRLLDLLTTLNLTLQITYLEIIVWMPEMEGFWIC
jgi:hypothetical protein